MQKIFNGHGRDQDIFKYISTHHQSLNIQVLGLLGVLFTNLPFLPDTKERQ